MTVGRKSRSAHRSRLCASADLPLEHQPAPHAGRAGRSGPGCDSPARPPRGRSRPARRPGVGHVGSPSRICRARPYRRPSRRRPPRAAGWPGDRDVTPPELAGAAGVPARRRRPRWRPARLVPEPLIRWRLAPGDVGLRCAADRLRGDGVEAVRRVVEAVRPRLVWWSARDAEPLGAGRGLRVPASWDLAATHRLLHGGSDREPGVVWAVATGQDPARRPRTGQLDLLSGGRLRDAGDPGRPGRAGAPGRAPAARLGEDRPPDAGRGGTLGPGGPRGPGAARRAAG